MVLTKKEMGEKIKAARKIKADFSGGRYTQEMLADDLGISRGYLGDIEAGRTYPNYVLLSKISDICGVSLSFFSNEQTPANQLNQLKEEKAFYYSENTPAIIKTLDLEEEALISRFRNLPPISQQTILTLIDNLEIIESDKNKLRESEVG